MSSWRKSFEAYKTCHFESDISGFQNTGKSMKKSLGLINQETNLGVYISLAF